MENIRICAFADEASNDLAGQIEALKRNGASLLEIRGVDNENIKNISLSKAREIKKALDDNGISVWSMGSPVGKNRIDEDFDKLLDEFKGICEKAHILGASKIRMFSFFTKDENEVFKRLEAFCNACPEDITLCHENEKEIFGDDIECCLKIYKAFDKIKMVFDPANFIQCGVDPREAWDTLSSYVDYMHIKDALKSGHVVPAGQGVGSLDYLISEYIKKGGKVLTLEPHLMEFCGLSELENGQSLSLKPVFTDTNTAFDAGMSALKKILDLQGVKYQ